MPRRLPTTAEAMAWMQTKQLEEYNALLFELHNGQPSGKTPGELWTVLSSATNQLPRQQLAIYAGRCHRVKFTKVGLVYQDKQAYTYYPKVSTDTARMQALELFAELKTRSSKGSKRTLYVLDYAKVTYVFERPWEAGGKYLGYWPLQKKVSMLETAEEGAAPRGGTSRQAGTDESLRRGARGLSQKALQGDGSSRHRRDFLDKKGHK